MHSRPERFNLIGETDFERAFCVLLDRLALIWKDRKATPTRRDRFSSCRRLPTNSGLWGRRLFCIQMAIFSSPMDIRRKHADTGGLKRQVSCCSKNIVKTASEASRRRAFYPKRRSACYAVRERSLDRRTVGTSCRRRVGCRRSWTARCAKIGERKSDILRVTHRSVGA